MVFHELERVFNLAALGGALRDFAALTAIFAKVGVANINSDLATFITHLRHSADLGADHLRHWPVPEPDLD